MTSLTVLEEWLTRYVVGGATGESEIEARIRGGGSLTKNEKIEIYRRGYTSRLRECLEDDYPVLMDALTAEVFAKVSRDYIEAHPSQSFSLNVFGRSMSAFLSGRAEEWAPFASDLAALEWAIVEAIHSPAVRTLDPESLGVFQGDPGNARFVFAPSLRLVSARFAVNAYYIDNREGREPPIPAPLATTTAVWQHDGRVWRLDPEPAAASLLESLRTGAPLGMALQGIEVEPAALSRWFETWTSSGFFASIARASDIERRA